MCIRILLRAHTLDLPVKIVKADSEGGCVAWTESLEGFLTIEEEQHA